MHVVEHVTIVARDAFPNVAQDATQSLRFRFVTGSQGIVLAKQLAKSVRSCLDCQITNLKFPLQALDLAPGTNHRASENSEMTAIAERRLLQVFAPLFRCARLADMLKRNILLAVRTQRRSHAATACTSSGCASSVGVPGEPPGGVLRGGRFVVSASSGHA